MFVLEARNVSKVYRAGSSAEVRALDDVSLGIEAGSFVLLRGPSGSGKTTLLALLGGMDRPTSGEVLVRDRSLGACSDAELARIRRRFGFVFQSFALIPGLKAWENVAYPLIPRGVPADERYRRAEGLLTRLGLKGRLDARPGELSGGEQQRVAAARALVGDPEVLFADEPTSSLDASSAEAVLGLLRESNEEGKTVVVSSHAGRVAGMEVVWEVEGGRVRRGSTESEGR